MEMPKNVYQAWKRLCDAGFECYAVGGCVRDGLLGIVPHDWDLTTNALPAQVMAVFEGEKVVPTGLQHGTVTVILAGEPLEITTYRADGEYSDHRRPNEVRFVPDIKEDLRRRDFTVNAMAWNPAAGLCDPFGGQADLEKKILRCVGEPAERFNEDALRILRALRFASTYGFAVETATAEALFALSPLLKTVAAERVKAELDRLLIGEHVGEILATFARVLYPVLPELAETEGVLQYNPYHDKDVLGHTVAAVAAAPAVLPVRLALLLHDCGKPHNFSPIREGFGHFPNHPAIGAEMAEKTLRRLRYDNKTTACVCRLIRHHDDPIPETDAGVRRWLCRMGEQELRWLLDVKEADCDGHAPNLPPARREELYRLRERITRVVSEGQCTSMAMLAVDGDALIAAGIPAGKAVGRALQWALDRVLDGELPNEKQALLCAILEQKDLII